MRACGLAVSTMRESTLSRTVAGSPHIRASRGLTPQNISKSNGCKHMIYMESKGNYIPIGEVKEADIEGQVETPLLSGEMTVECEGFVALIEELVRDVESNNSRKMRGLGTRRGIDNALYKIRRYYAKHK